MTKVSAPEWSIVEWGWGTKLCWTLRTRKNYDVGIKNVNKHIQDAIKNVNQRIKDAVENAIFERRR